MPTQEIRQRVDQQLEELYRRHQSLHEDEVVGYYAPGSGYLKPGEFVKSEHKQFAICLATTDGETFCAGDHDHPFALQSISKVFVYGLALEDHGRDYVLKRVGVEPSGDAFNSIVFDERNNRPYNPMVNAGALATTDLVESEDPAEDLDRILAVLKRYAGDENLEVDEDVFALEMGSADRNRATSYLMRSYGMISHAVEENLALYLRQCSVYVTSRDLAVMAATLANGGVNPVTKEQALSSRYVRDILSVMHTCGMYDFAGEWAYQVGIPAKSGVSGGILAVVPGKLGIGVFSPGLDAYGNSVRGIKVCEEISERLGLHVFADETEDALLGTKGSRKRS
jgi:glutaminase